MWCHCSAARRRISSAAVRALLGFFKQKVRDVSACDRGCDCIGDASRSSRGACAGEPGPASGVLPAGRVAEGSNQRAAVPDFRLLLQVHAARKACRSNASPCSLACGH